MVTGDNQITAEAIAIDCGIISNHQDPDYDSSKHVLLGVDFIERIGGVVCSKCKTIICPCPTKVKDAKL